MHGCAALSELHRTYEKGQTFRFAPFLFFVNVVFLLNLAPLAFPIRQPISQLAFDIQRTAKWQSTAARYRS